eukprot:8087528-Pyramimonas_sp.AAC.1
MDGCRRARPSPPAPPPRAQVFFLSVLARPCPQLSIRSDAHWACRLRPVFVLDAWLWQSGLPSMSTTACGIRH